MADVHHAAASRQLRILFDVGTVAGQSDGQLLELFVSRRDESAFAALIERHGPMVQRVCQEVLGNLHDAQDAFQATFLILARRASAIRRRDSLASWLYGVALRVGSCARSASARRRRHERSWAALRGVEAGNAGFFREGSEPLLHAELGRLPERFRAPVVLCYLEGRTYDEAAQVLCCPVGTIKSRLATARERLRRRLARLEPARMSGPAGLSLDPAKAQPPPGVSAQLVECTLQEVARDSAGSGMIATRIANLAQPVLKTMFWNGWSAVAGALVLSAVMVTGAIGLAWSVKRSAAETPVKGEALGPQTAASQPPRAFSDGQTTKPQAVTRTGLPMTLTGRVIDEQARPVPNAEVRLRLLRSSLRPLRLAALLVDLWNARTDAEGRYRIEGVRGIEGDDYQQLALDVGAPDYVEYCQWHFSNIPQAVASKGNLAEVQLKRGVAVTGRCVGPDGMPAAGAKIRSAYADEPMSSLARTKTTDADGRFRLTIPAGRDAELIVYPQSLAPLRVSVAAGGGELGDIKLETGVELVGHLRASSRVFVGTNPAPVLKAIADNPGESGVDGSVIAFESIDRGEFGGFPITLALRADPIGSFHVPALKGSFKVWTAPSADSGPDDDGPVAGSGPIPAALPRIIEFDPRSGGPRQNLALVPEPEVAIRGTITGPDGKPAKGVCLWLITGMGEGSRLTPIRWTSSDSSGRYSLTGVPRGLTQAFLEVFAAPPDNGSFGGVTASGHFQGRADAASVAFEPLLKDQDPLDFRVKFETLPQPTAPKVVTAEEKELIKLGEEVERLQNEFSKAVKDRPSPAQQVALYREKYPPNVLANRFLELARAHPDHPVAISALGFVFRAATGAGDRDAPISKAREQAIEQVIERHLANPDIALFFSGLQFGVPTPRGEVLLREALSRSPHREVRAAAAYELARFLRFKADLPADLKALRARPQPDDPATRLAWESTLHNLERFARGDAKKARAEAEQLFERVEREFGDVTQAQFMVDGPGHVQYSRYTAANAKLKTYRALAGAALFELRNLAVGRPAPDIEGEDSDGVRFKLSDYRGKVVVLTFSGNWCGPCRELYPHERAMVSRLKDRPFAMLSVNTDTERETLRKSIGDREITWRCWWDGGQDGPITSRWNLLSFPTVFVIDAKGTIREIGLRDADLDKAVDRLLAEAAAPGKN